tara:strand:- start:374 stop:586 length:213 start_codon:yes stop_codon:yes gene_type:complete
MYFRHSLLILINLNIVGAESNGTELTTCMIHQISLVEKTGSIPHYAVTDDLQIIIRRCSGLNLWPPKEFF